MLFRSAPQLAAARSARSLASAAAPAAGGRGIDGSRCVYSLGVRGLPAGGVVETAAWLERRLAAVVPSSALDAPVDARGRSAAAGAVAAPWSRGAPIPELVAVVAARALVRGVLLLVLVGSLQVEAPPSLADAVGVAGVGRIWWRLDADGYQSSRFRRMRRMALAASSTRLVELATSECGFLVSFFPGGVLLVVVGDVWRGGSVFRCVRVVLACVRACVFVL